MRVEVGADLSFCIPRQEVGHRNHPFTPTLDQTQREFDFVAGWGDSVNRLATGPATFLIQARGANCNFFGKAKTMANGGPALSITSGNGSNGLRLRDGESVEVTVPAVTSGQIGPALEYIGDAAGATLYIQLVGS